jgi:hypothetical protein
VKTAAVVVVLFALFIALVEWRRHYAERGLSRGAADTRVSADRALRASSRVLGTRHEKETSGAPSAGATPDAGASADEEAAGRREQERPRDLHAEQKAERKKAEAAMDAIQRLMDAERRDETWAPAVEAWVRANYGKKSGSHLERVECKKTLCSADGTHDTEALYADWVSRFTGQDRSLRVLTMPSVRPDGKTRARSFILKDERAAPSKVR